MKTLEQIATVDPRVTVAECRAFCRLFDTSQDATLEILRDAAIEFIEGQLREQIRERQWRLTTSGGDTISGLVFPKWPVISIDAVTLDGVDQDVGDYVVDATTNPPQLDGDVSGSEQIIEWTAGVRTLPAARKLLILQVVRDNYFADQLSSGTRLLLESENQHIDAVIS